MNERPQGEAAACQNCDADLVPRLIYTCTGCGDRIEGPPEEPPVFEVPISRNECDVCEFIPGGKP